ncbi:unnamed protein product [Mortierella alpina]
MSNSSTECTSASISLRTACLSIHSSDHTVTASANFVHDDCKKPLFPEPVIASRNPQQSLSKDSTFHSSSQQETQPGALSTDAHAPADAWAGQGHFPLLLGAVSRLSVPLRGGARVVLTGMNFREGVQVVFACPQLLDGSLDTKIITPKVLKSTELELFSPCLLDWWTLLNRTQATPVLKVSVSLVCAGSKDTSDVDTTFEMIAVEDSETELLHGIIALHRQLIQASLTSAADVETERNTRQKTLTLLSLEQPPSVSRSEHLALGVIYMLGDECDTLTQESMIVLQATTEDGHDMLHLAVILDLPTLVREVSRHLLARYKTLPMTAECDIFAQDPNGQTPLDFARTLERKEIQQVLESTLSAAREFRATSLGIAHDARPTLPARKATRSVEGEAASSIGSIPSFHSTPDLSLTGEVTNRPLPPTPLTSPYNGTENCAPELNSYFQTTSASSSAASLQDAHTAHSSPRNHSSQLSGEVSNHRESRQVLHEGSFEYTSVEQRSRPPLASSPDGPRSYLSSMPHPTSVHPQEQQQHHTPLHLPQLQPLYPYPQQPVAHSLPIHTSANGTLPLRAHSVPLPKPNHLQVHQRPQSIYQSSVAPFRPLPATPYPPTMPLPPPKHIVKRINRPKQFTVPSIQDYGGIEPLHEEPPLQYYPAYPQRRELETHGHNPQVSNIDSNIKVPIV